MSGSPPPQPEEEQMRMQRRQQEEDEEVKQPWMSFLSGRGFRLPEAHQAQVAQAVHANPEPRLLQA